MITLSSRSETAYRLEVLPLVLAADGVRRLLPPPGWAPPVAPAGHPELAVAAALEAAALTPAVVHSTSWRFETGGLVVTYLAVLDGGAVPAGWSSSAVARAELAWGTPTAAPERVEGPQVVEHALRHLAWLAAGNAAIGAALPAGWAAALGGYALPLAVDMGGGGDQDSPEDESRGEAGVAVAVAAGRRA